MFILHYLPMLYGVTYGQRMAGHAMKQVFVHTPLKKLQLRVRHRHKFRQALRFLLELTAICHIRGLMLSSVQVVLFQAIRLDAGQHC